MILRRSFSGEANKQRLILAGDEVLNLGIAEYRPVTADIDITDITTPAFTDAALHPLFQSGYYLCRGKTEFVQNGEGKPDHNRWPANDSYGVVRRRSYLPQHLGNKALSSCPAFIAPVNGSYYIYRFIFLSGIQVILETEINRAASTIDNIDIFIFIPVIDDIPD